MAHGKDVKIVLVSSSGGHLTEITQLESFYKKYDHFFVTFKRPDSEELAKREKVYFTNDPKRNPWKFFTNSIKSLYILIKERPNVILTTGAGMAIPICLLGKLSRRKFVFIESFCRINEASATGKVLYRFSDLFLVQWEETLKAYGNKAKYVGGVFI